MQECTNLSETITLTHQVV